jgi:alkylated DNA repair dioxygenase AlkB
MDIKVIKEQSDPDTVFCYIKNFLSNDEIMIYHNYLKSLPEFIDGGSRSQKWYQIDKKYFCPKWDKRFKKWYSFEYDDDIKKIQNNIINKLENYQLDNYGISVPKINSCLINKYKDGNDYIMPHRDTHLTFGKHPTIINVSIGTTRELLFKKHNNDQYKYNLESGSLFIMTGSSQELYTHEITKSNTKHERFSLTFRQVL